MSVTSPLSWAKPLVVSSFALVTTIIAVESACAVSIFGINNTTKKFTVDSAESSLQTNNVAVVSNNNTNIYIGTNQISSDNQNPIITSFTNGERDWVFSDIETTGADSRGVALLWDGNNQLYAAFTTDGTQGLVTEDFRRFTQNGWLDSYGQGGGAKATVLLKIELDKIDPDNPNNTTGVINNGTFVYARLDSGNTNTLVPSNMYFLGTDIVLEAQSFFSPLDINKNQMVQTIPSQSPFDYTITFDNNLIEAKDAVSPGWNETLAVPFGFKPSMGLIISLIALSVPTILKKVK